MNVITVKYPKHLSLNQPGTDCSSKDPTSDKPSRIRLVVPPRTTLLDLISKVTAALLKHSTQHSTTQTAQR